MRRFEIFYSDGSIVSGETATDWELAPSTGVQAVVVLHDDMRAQERLYGLDYYILGSGNKVHATDELMPGYVKYGELIPVNQFLAIRDSTATHSRIWNMQEGDAWDTTPRQLLLEM